MSGAIAGRHSRLVLIPMLLAYGAGGGGGVEWWTIADWEFNLAVYGVVFSADCWRGTKSEANAVLSIRDDNSASAQRLYRIGNWRRSFTPLALGRLQ